MLNELLTTGHIVLIGSFILFVAILAAKSSYRFGAPTLLIFLLVGMLFGGDGLGLEFNSPRAAQFVGVLALSIILFCGGMETRYSGIRPVAVQGVVLATLGVFLTAMCTGFFIYLISVVFGIHISLAESFLLAAMMSSTDSATVFSILRSKKQGLQQNLRPLLELESGSNDPMAYILTILLIESISGGGDITVAHSVLMFVVQMSIGALAGFIFGKAAVKIINAINLQNKSLYSVLLLSMVFMIFSITDLVKGNGYLAVYIAGLVVGNHKIVFQKSLTTFFDGFTWLFQIVMFITLGLLANPRELIDVAEIGLLVAVFMIIVARPLSVLLCLAPFRKMTLKAKAYVSWVGLRGAVPIIFATYPLVAGLENAGLIFNTVFFITIVSMLVQGTTVGYMAGLLGLSAEMEQDSFNIDMPDEIKAALTEMEVKPDFLVHGNTLKEITLQPNTLVMMIRRGDHYIVPKGDTAIEVGDRILFISTDAASLPDDYAASISRRHRVKERMSRLLPSRRGRRQNPAMHDDGESEIDLEVLCEMEIMEEDPDYNDAVEELEVQKMQDAKYKM